jgi:hypothetical protein
MTAFWHKFGLIEAFFPRMLVHRSICAAIRVDVPRYNEGQLTLPSRLAGSSMRRWDLS